MRRSIASLRRALRASLAFLTSLGALLAPAALGAQSAPDVPISNAFTYQGFLAQNGGAVNGAWDFQFLLFDAAVGGVQIGSTATLNDQAVTAGVFSVLLNFGQGAFGGGARWLEARVRPGASVGPYTTLSPRTTITPAPMALSMPNVFTDEAANFVGVGRDFRVSGNEVFGIRAPTAADTYGGMYVETTNPNGWPFYGFATDGSFRSWIYYDASACPDPCTDWTLLKGLTFYGGGVRLKIPDSGGLRIGPSADYSLVIQNTTGSDGIRVYDTGDDAIQVGSDPDYSNYGLYIPSPGVSTYGLWPNTAAPGGEWALFTVDGIEAGNVLASSLSQLARVDGDEPIAPGSIVAVTGAATALPGAHQLVPKVVAATAATAEGVIGVVQSRMALTPHPGKTGDDAVGLGSVAGDALPGEFVTLIVRGIANVRIEVGAAIEVGQRLTVGQEPGRSRARRSRTIEGMLVVEGAPTIGVALAANGEDEFVPVYVSVQ